MFGDIMSYRYMFCVGIISSMLSVALYAIPAQRFLLTPIERDELSFNFFVKNSDKTHTTFGHHQYRVMAEPITEQKTIEHRQSMIRCLVESRDLLASLQKSLQQCGAFEDSLLAYCEEEDFFAEKIADKKLVYESAESLYFTTRFSQFKPLVNCLNGSELGLEAALVRVAGKEISLMTFMAFLMYFYEEISHRNAGSGFSFKEIFKKALTQPFKLHMPWKHVYSDEYKRERSFATIRLEGTAGDVYSCWKEQLNDLFGYSGRMLSSILPFDPLASLGSLFFIGVEDYFLYDRLFTFSSGVTSSYKKCAALQKELCKVASLLNELERLAQYIDEHPVLRDCSEFKPLVDFFYAEGGQSSACQELLELLKTETFQEPVGYFYRRGRVLQAHALALEIAEDELRPLLESLAFVDVYVAVATLFTQAEQRGQRYCFVEFQEADHNVLILDDFWLPLLPSSHVVLNSIALGGKGMTESALFTGPNGGGKSMSMQGIVYAVVGGHSFGIAPALRAHMSLFTGIRTSLRPQEDIQKELSTFMAEMERINAIEKEIQIAGKNERYLVVLDEPYHGTIEVESERRVCDLGMRIARNRAVTGLIATHLQKPITLEQLTNGAFVNFHPEIEKTADGTFKRTFKLKQGAAWWWFNDTVLRREFLDSLQAVV